MAGKKERRNWGGTEQAGPVKLSENQGVRQPYAIIRK